MFKGTLVKKELEFHQKYGQLFRIAPNELSITKEEAQIDMHATRPGHQIPGKDPLWYQSAADAVPNLITSTNPEVHARMRNLIKGSFSEQTLRSQQPLIESYGDLFVERLRAMATAAETGGRGAAINIVGKTISPGLRCSILTSLLTGSHSLQQILSEILPWESPSIASEIRVTIHGYRIYTNFLLV